MDSLLAQLRARLRNVRIFVSPQSRRRFLLHLLVLAVVFLVATILVRRHFEFLTDVRALREFIRGYGILAPLVLIALQAAQVVLAPIPGQVLAVVAGYLFGMWWGTFYNMVGITIGSSVAFWLSRRYGRGYVESIVHEDALEQFDAVSEDYGRSALFVIFLLPGLPDDVICFAGGLTEIPLWQLVGIAIVGRAPAFFLVNVVGDLLGTEQFVAAVTLTVVLLVISALGYLHRDRLVRFFEDSPSE